MSNTFGVRAWLRWLWRTITSMRTALILLFLLAVASIPGSLFPQRSADPIAVDEYIADNPGISGFLEAVGMFNVFSSPWFAAIYLLLCLSLIGCIIPRTLEHARALRRQPPATPSRLDKLAGFRQQTVESSPEDVLTTARQALKGWRIRQDGESLSAERGYWRETGNLVFHISLLVILVGVALGAMMGWRGSVIITEGRGFSNTLTQYDNFSAGPLVDVSTLPAFSVKLDEFTARFQRGGEQNGAPRDYSATVTITPEPGAPSRTDTLSVNDPLSVQGTRVHLQGHGYAPTFRITDTDGQVVFDDSVVFLPRDGNLTSTGVVKVPDSQPQLGLQGIFLPTAYVDPERGPISTFPEPDQPAVFLSAWEGDIGLDSGTPQSVYRLTTDQMQQIGLQTMVPGETWNLPNGMTVEFLGFEDYVSLTVSQDPGKTVVLVASILAVIAIMVSLFVPRLRVWVRAETVDGHTVLQVAGLARTENSNIPHVTEQLMNDLTGGD